MSGVERGFEISGDRYLKAGSLPLHPGLTVLYGVNGSGKSRLLAAVGAALHGEAAAVTIVGGDDLELLDLDQDPDESTGRLLSETSATASALQERALRLYDAVLLDAPRLALDETGWTCGGLRFADLSRAQRVWAVRAINLAAASLRRELRGSAPETRSLIALIDEPEASLHRAAEAHMAAALQTFSPDPLAHLVVATHSPHLLDHREAHVLQAQDGAFREVSGEDVGDLSHLGLHPSDLLNRTRVFVVVEGHHEEVILTALFGDRLRAARAVILPVGGAKHLSAVTDSRVLFDFTGAHVVAVVDSQRSDVLRQAWDDALAAKTAHGIDDAVTIVIDRIKNASRTDEAGFISSWLISGLRKGIDGRLTPLGLSRGDVLEYLPVSSFVPGATSWDELRETHRLGREQRPEKTPKDFKTWFARQGGIVLDDDTILAAVAALPAVPAELEELMSAVATIAAS